MGMNTTNLRFESMAEKTMKNRHVLLFPFPFQGHINPMLELAAVLQSRNFSVIIFHTDYNYEAVHPSKFPSYRFITIPDRVSKLTTSSSQDHNLSLIHLLNDNCTTPFRDSLAQVLSENYRDQSVPCLVLDMNWYKINPVAELLGVPTLVLRTSSAASLNGFIALPALYRMGIQPSKAEWELELPPMRVRDMIALANDPEQLLKFVALEIEKARTSSQPMEGAKSEKLHKHEQDEAQICMQSLNTHLSKSVLYVTFRSLALMNPEVLTEMARGLADSGQPFLQVIRPGYTQSIVCDKLALPDEFQNTMHGINMIFDWSPQRDVLVDRAIGDSSMHTGDTAPSTDSSMPAAHWIIDIPDEPRDVLVERAIGDSSMHTGDTAPSTDSSMPAAHWIIDIPDEPRDVLVDRAIGDSSMHTGDTAPSTDSSMPAAHWIIDIPDVN